uniref:SIMPL domain-containing protein n=1 Tax=Aliarcobacter sp. TaxID=2321116 RepID=UPI0040470EDD
MKKKLLIFSLFLLPIFSFSYEINFNKTFSKVVNPDLLSTQIHISVEKKDENRVNIELEKFNDFIKNNKNVIFKNGSFRLSPKYNYSNNKQEFVGYLGNLTYTIESKNAKDINSFINELISIKDKTKSQDIKLNISNVSWKASDDLENKSYDDLRLDSIVWIENYALDLSKKLSKNCEVQKINVNELNRGNIVYARSEMMYSTSSKAIADVSPINSEQNISINPNFVLECK